MTRADKRLIARDACTWCGHGPHADQCPKKIRVGARPETFSPCPCARRAA